jgi:cell division protein FtsB
MARKRKEVVVLTRLEARTRVIRGAGHMVFIAFGVSLGFVVVATAVPQWRELGKLETKLQAAVEREQSANTVREHRRIELKALREDPAYLEIHARDRLDYSREGERVLRIRRDR